tara:strand:+ start:116 stop:415 length:300 start_codon:yes stop_codon:yes gene_type:complete
MSIKSIYIRCDEKTFKLAKKLAQSNERSVNKQMVHLINSTARDQNIKIDEVETKESQKELQQHGLHSWDANGSEVENDSIGLKGLVGIPKLDVDHTNND